MVVVSLRGIDTALNCDTHEIKIKLVKIGYKKFFMDLNYELLFFFFFLEVNTTYRSQSDLPTARRMLHRELRNRFK